MYAFIHKMYYETLATSHTLFFHSAKIELRVYKYLFQIVK